VAGKTLGKEKKTKVVREGTYGRVLRQSSDVFHELTKGKK